MCKYADFRCADGGCRYQISTSLRGTKQSLSCAGPAMQVRSAYVEIASQSRNDDSFISVSAFCFMHSAFSFLSLHSGYDPFTVFFAPFIQFKNYVIQRMAIFGN